VVLACTLGGCGGTSASDSQTAARLVVDGGVVQAHTLPGDQLLAGPELLDHRAVWVEAGHRLLVRSLDAHGRTRTIFSTSTTPGAPKGTIWPYWVRSIAAGDGRVAFVEAVTQCGSAPPHLPRCLPSGAGAPVDSVTLFAGRPGAIRPVESLVLPSRHCRRESEPRAVAITDAGIVDYEIAANPCTQGVSRLVLRSFSGRLLRVLASKLPVETKDFAAAGDWAAYVRSSETSEPSQLNIVRLRTGQNMLRLRRRCLRSIEAMSLDRSGRFALATSGGRNSSACPQQRGSTVMVGQVGHNHLRTLATHVLVGLPTTSIAMSDGDVAYGRSAGHSHAGKQVVIATPGAAPATIPGMKYGPLAFDGHVVATARDDTVQLAALHRG